MRLLAILQCKKGSVLAFVIMAIVILSIFGLGLLAISYGVRFNASMIQSEAVAMLAAEAGYEGAVFWMGQQSDMAYVMKAGGSHTDSLNFPNSGCDYRVSLYSFVGSRPIYRVISDGYSGRFKRTVDVLLVQAIGGWDMGACRIPNGSSSTSPVYFADGEIIDMPMHINKQQDNPDSRDIFITGDPQFLEDVSMGESRYTGGGSDKYSGVMDVFDAGIEFDQPNNKITDGAAVQKKIDRFKGSTKSACIFTPVAKASVPNPQPAVQLEFFVDNSGVGNVRITNNCTVRGFQQSSDSRTWDFIIKPGTTDQFQRYDIYAYHLSSSDADSTGERVTRTVESTYVTQTIGGIESEPGGQIFVNGNVIIGGNNILGNNWQVVKGKVTIVAAGNIWVADGVVLDGPHDADGMPSKDNPNALGLISQGVIKVVDPGMSEYSYVDGLPIVPAGSDYVPVGVPDAGQPVDTYLRHLPDPMVLEAGVTVGGGGWGAENVQRSGNGGRKEFSGNQDDLVVRGTITEVIRGIVGQIGADGFLKHYYFDRRFLEGILPGDMWLRGKYVPAPAGWRDYETVQ
jgi:hypothetical protein